MQAPTLSSDLAGPEPRSGAGDAEDRPAPVIVPGLPSIAPRLYCCIDAIARLGSIRKAAAEIGIAPSALNRRLIDIEEQVGVTLFLRLRQGLRLTPSGLLVAEHVRETLSGASRLADRLRNLDGGIRGPVTIASAESAATAILPRMLGALHHLHPDLFFSVSVGGPDELLGLLSSDRADLILTHEVPRPHEATILGSASEPFCAVMRPGHPLAGEAALTLERCLAFPIVVAAENLAARSLFERLSASAPGCRPVTLTTNLFETMKRFVAVTDAISFQFQIRPRTPAVPDTIVAVPIEDKMVQDAQLYLACRTGRVLPPAVQLVADRIGSILVGETMY